MFALLKPEYLFRPSQIFRRLFPPAPSSDGFTSAWMPGGCRIRVNPDDDLGRALLHLGVFDLIVTETIWRLADPGEGVADVGANIGYMSLVLAARVAPNGNVWCFEPHPTLFKELSANCDRGSQSFGGVRFHARQLGVSDSAGQLKLLVFDETSKNRGTSALISSDEEASGSTISVNVALLDEIVPPDTALGVMKIDVEGHELAVLKGARRLLESRRVRDIVFEEHREYPTDVTNYLEHAGMRVFRLHRDFFGPRLLAPNATTARSTWIATSFLATFDTARAEARFKARGWRCLQRS
ncbi:MAG: FkbM family methyltransferase [Anaerolineae bacterium]|nr:FkbM family methyltransferase [Phycisphaerae bacterium]